MFQSTLNLFQKGHKTYFNDYIRNKWGHLRYAKDYLAYGLHNVKSKLLEWKARLLHAKGHFLKQKGDKYWEKAKAASYKEKPKVKGYYYDDDYYYKPGENEIGSPC